MGRPSKATYESMVHLTDNIDTKNKEAIIETERILCLVFKKQFTAGTYQCYALRRTLTDLYKAINK